MLDAISPDLVAVTRRLVLVDLYWTRDKDPRIPLGHASLLASCARYPLDVRSVVLPVNLSQLQVEDIVARILSHLEGVSMEDAVLALGAYVWGEAILRGVLSGVRERGFTGRIVLGGPQISYSGAGLEQLYPEADAFIRGYGEDALPAMAMSHDKIKLPGLHWAGQLDREEQAKIDLESIPSPWLERIIPLDNQPFVRWETQRGCQFRCAFCQHREAGARLTRRSLDHTRTFQEIDLFCEQGVQDIAVLDPIFNTSPIACEVLQRFHERGFKGRLSLQCRAEMMDERFIEAASKLNTRLEFGLQTIHKNEGKAVKRPNHMPSIEQTLARVRAAGIEHEVSLIFGLPEQTLESFEQSVSWCLEREVDAIKAFPLLLLRGTPLERERARWGMQTCEGEMPVVIASATFGHQEWVQMARLSEALKVTEGEHPTTLAELQAIARGQEPDMLRWIAHEPLPE